MQGETKKVKKHQLILRMDDEELARVRRLALRLGIGKQEAIRLLLKMKADELRV